MLHGEFQSLQLVHFFQPVLVLQDELHMRAAANCVWDRSTPSLQVVRHSAQPQQHVHAHGQ